MAIKGTLKDGTGTNIEAKIDSNHALYVTELGVPPSGIGVTLKPLSGFMENNGSEDMLVVGSLATPIDFIIGSSVEGDRYIHTMSFTLADVSASLNQFGNLTALVNGCQIIYQDDVLGDVIIADALKTNFDFVQLCNFEPSFGTGSAAFLASNVAGSSEAYVPVLDIKDVFGVPYGLLLPKASTKKLILRVRDDVSGIDRFDVKVFGFDRIDTSEE